MLQLFSLPVVTFILNALCVMEDYLNLFGISIPPFSPYETPLNIQIHRPISMPGISSGRGSCWFSWMEACWVLDFPMGAEEEVLGRNDELG